MPFSPTLYQGAVGAYNVDELAETGVLTKSLSFSIDSSAQETKAHVSASKIDQIVRTRIINRGLIIDWDVELVLSAGLATGIGKTFAGQNIATCAHFSSAATDSRLGYIRDDTKLLQTMEPTLSLSHTDPAALKFKSKYFPEIAFDSASA